MPRSATAIAIAIVVVVVPIHCPCYNTCSGGDTCSGWRAASTSSCSRRSGSWKRRKEGRKRGREKEGGRVVLSCARAAMPLTELGAAPPLHLVARSRWSVEWSEVSADFKKRIEMLEIASECRFEENCRKE